MTEQFSHDDGKGHVCMWLLRFRTLYGQSNADDVNKNIDIAINPACWLQNQEEPLQTAPGPVERRKPTTHKIHNVAKLRSRMQLARS